VATGPASVFVLTAARLEWTVHGATAVTTDDGTRLTLHLDPPAVVKAECRLSVQRWRWRNVQRKFPALCSGNLGVGAEMTGIWSLLRSREQSSRWNYQFRGALKSALAGRQYTQSRCFAAGFATHKACLVCLHHLMGKKGEPEAKTNMTAAGKKMRSGKFDDSHLTAIPPDDVLEHCPVGNMHHRAWTCPHSDAQRNRGVGDHIVAAALRMQGNDPLGDRGLYPVQIVPVPPKPTEDTFEWVIMPPGGLVTGTIYTDGSRLDGKVAILAVNGWAFVAVDAGGTVTAIARGVPAPWITDIPGRKLGRCSKRLADEPPTPLSASTASRALPP